MKRFTSKAKTRISALARQKAGKMALAKHKKEKAKAKVDVPAVIPMNFVLLRRKQQQPKSKSLLQEIDSVMSTIERTQKQLDYNKKLLRNPKNARQKENAEKAVKVFTQKLKDLDDKLNEISKRFGTGGKN